VVEEVEEEVSVEAVVATAADNRADTEVEAGERQAAEDMEVSNLGTAADTNKAARATLRLEASSSSNSRRRAAAGEKDT